MPAKEIPAIEFFAPFTDERLREVREFLINKTPESRSIADIDEELERRKSLDPSSKTR